MYRQFFGLASAPFELTTDLRFLFMTARHREALSNLRYGVAASKALTLLVGEAGTGKTTIIRAFLASHTNTDRFVYVDNPRLTRREFYELLACRLGLSAAAAGSKAQFLVEMESRSAGQRGSCVVLIIDEAQAMPPEFLEEVRLLTNLEIQGGRPISIILSGQQELADRLEEPAFRSLKQRVALRCELAPFDLDETADYIAGRIRTAGGNPAHTFTREAVVAVHEYSRGIARTISVICDNALVAGFASDVRPVDDAIIVEVCRDFRLERQRTAGRALKPAGRSATARQDPEAAGVAARHRARPSLLEHLRDLVLPRRRVYTADTTVLHLRTNSDETVQN